MSLKESAIPHENPISTTPKLYLFFFPHLMKRRMEIARGQPGTLLFLLAASLTLAEINVEALIKLRFNRSDVTIEPLHRSLQQLNEVRWVTQRQVMHLSSQGNSTFLRPLPVMEKLAASMFLVVAYKLIIIKMSKSNISYTSDDLCFFYFPALRSHSDTLFRQS